MTLLKRGGALLRRLTDQPTEKGMAAATPVGIKHLAPEPMHAPLTSTLDERPTQAFALMVAARKARDAVRAAGAGDMEGAVTDGAVSAMAVASSSPATRSITANAAATAFTHTMPKVAEAVTPALGAIGATLRASPGVTGGVIAGAFVAGEVGALIYRGAPAEMVGATVACGGMEVFGNAMAGTAGAETGRTACVRYFADQGIAVRPGFIQETVSRMVRPVDLTSEQRAFYDYFDRIPDNPTADPALNELVMLKRDLVHAAAKVASLRYEAGFPEHSGLMERTAAEERLIAAETDFSNRYDALAASGLPATPLNSSGKPPLHRS